MYAIRNTVSKRWMYGTNFRVFPHQQRTATDNAMLFATIDEAKLEFKRRMCGQAYEIVPVRLEVIEDDRVQTLH